jgi:hypothetical protein
MILRCQRVEPGADPVIVFLRIKLPIHLARVFGDGSVHGIRSLSVYRCPKRSGSLEDVDLLITALIFCF